MWFVSGGESRVAASTPTLAALAQTKIRSDQLDSSERELIADLFMVLESLVLRDELPAEARGAYDHAVLRLARHYG